ncbi:HlyD family efflux transporter periplasmic adaptor subunit [Francisella sp. LA112445]|uniref:HlyD family secretion protein n=1 Tax=Francisella sp. LA112445 TaxID=1395624 RepID=UPI001788CE76|nr:HlyD family efflux transporter periplasmic adaptor subunit [Francisella sp. LA112445]QIW10505.1 HlyD family efflux transporter periplasmic adaptor subunit [Francisella sp. LA112445]
MFDKRKGFAIALLLIICTLGLVYYFLRSKAEVIPGYISTDIRYISSDESGRLLDLKVKEGQYITKGQQLFVLDSSKNQTLLKSNKFLHQASVAIANNLSKGKRQPYLDRTKLDIKTAKANLEVAKEEYVRQKALLKDDSTSKKQFEQAKGKLVEAINQVRNLEVMQVMNKMPAREDLVAAANYMSMFVNSNSNYLQQKIDSADVKASQNGYVYQIFYRVGEEVRAYNPIITVINPLDVYVVFYVSKQDLAKVQINQKVSIENTDGKNIPAEISYISNKAEYTPPLLYGINSDSEISFEVKARVQYSPKSSLIHIGEPVKVELQ